jgi:4-hydroxy-tetrahydrodipicolinate reductase
MFRVLITGATGRMGLETVKAVMADQELELVGALGNTNFIGQDIGRLAGIRETGIKVKNNLAEVIAETGPDTVIDLTSAEAGYQVIIKCLEQGINCVSGSTGFSREQLAEIEKQANEKKITVMIIPNFSIGAVLMMKFSEQAARYFKNVEIIEMHHEKKKDSPSGTAIKTAEMIIKNSGGFNENLPESLEKIAGCRGGRVGNINIHSLRLPGFVATQEVVFGGTGQLLRLRHETISREAFMPGIIFSVKKSRETSGYVYGLESLL